MPKFGNWESEDNVPYTVYFEKARKGRGGKMINPNDPQENPDAFSKMPPSYPAPAPPPPRTKAQAEEPMGHGAARTTRDQRRMSREDGNHRQFAESPARTDNTSRRTSGDHSSQQHYGHGSNSGRPSRPSAGSEHSFEKSPLHPHYQAKLRGPGGGSPAREGKNSYDSSHGTPTRSRMKPVTRADGSPDRGAAVPRFGEWDEKNPQSADNFTHIFNQVREERHTGSSNAPGAKFESPYHNARQRSDDSNKGCCFPFLRK